MVAWFDGGRQLSPHFAYRLLRGFQILIVDRVFDPGHRRLVCLLLSFGWLGFCFRFVFLGSYFGWNLLFRSLLFRFFKALFCGIIGDRPMR